MIVIIRGVLKQHFNFANLAKIGELLKMVMFPVAFYVIQQ